MSKNHRTLHWSGPFAANQVSIVTMMVVVGAKSCIHPAYSELRIKLMSIKTVVCCQSDPTHHIPFAAHHHVYLGNTLYEVHQIGRFRLVPQQLHCWFFYRSLSRSLLFLSPLCDCYSSGNNAYFALPIQFFASAVFCLSPPCLAQWTMFIRDMSSVL